MSRKSLLGIGGALVGMAIGAAMVSAEPAKPGPNQNPPKPDGKPADMTKPVKVFILMGQSNMVGMGKIAGGEGSLENAVKNKSKYSYLVDDAGNWSERKDVRNVRVMTGKGGGMQVFNNEWMTVKGTKTIGPEFGIGHVVGNAIDAPVMILKSCIGNRSLGWDLLPPGSERFEFEGKIYAGYKDSPDSWAKGTEPKPIGWYAGKQYDDDVANAKKVLAEFDKYYPGAKQYEVAGFFFWQGEKTAETPGMRVDTSRTSSGSSSSCAWTSMLRTRNSSLPPWAKPRREAEEMREKCSRPSSRLTAPAASTRSSKAMWPRSIPTPCLTAAAATAITAVMLKPIWTSVKPWARPWRTC